ncbi:MAG: endonuclease, partial [Planctomycetota bacterium]
GAPPMYRTACLAASRGVAPARPHFGHEGLFARAWPTALAVLVVIGCAGPVSGQPPAGYYNGTAGLNGALLEDALHNIIDDHNPIPYNAVSFDVRDAIEILDEDPTNPANVILIYSGFSVPKSTWPDWNREHVWPVSLGPYDGSIAHSDLHHLFACDAGVNSTRNNRYFEDCESDCGIPGEAPAALFDFSVWEPPDSGKGDVARAIFYMAVRYRGDAADEPSLSVANVESSSGCDCIGYLDTLLAWHIIDPVSAEEIERNDTIFDLWQGNRNPFVDHPEFVAAIWGEPEFDADLWINEFHYDNSGADADEGVEVAGAAGTSLAAWSLVAYNGNGEEAYDSIPLSGTLPDEGNGFGALWFDFAPLQNGAPDGLALVGPAGVAIEFLSYEGTVVAVDGPAAGQTSTDVGVLEMSAPVDTSLQRTGTGTTGTDFTWVGPVPHSRGLLNSGQSFPVTSPPFIRGDCNGDTNYDIGDAVTILDRLFSGAIVPCDDACDANHDGSANIADAIFVLSGLFSMGADPPAPFPTCAPATGGPPPVGCTTPGC